MIIRRSFIIASGLTALASTRVFGANDKLRLGIIGAGHRMKGLLDAADKTSGLYEIVAVSDVYGPARDAIVERSNGLATAHLDYREVLQKDIDAVIIASPDHWHVRMALEALKAGKDVYLEKPVTHTIEEGAMLTRAIRASKQILQCGMQQRSWSHFRDAVEMIQGGSLGRVVQVRTYWWQNYHRTRPPKPTDQQALDWKHVAGLRAGSALQRRKIHPLALVLELWRRRDDRSVHALDRRGALGDEGRSAEAGAHDRGQIHLRAVGLSGHDSGGLPLSQLRRGVRGHDEFFDRRWRARVPRHRGDAED